MRARVRRELLLRRALLAGRDQHVLVDAGSTRGLDVARAVADRPAAREIDREAPRRLEEESGLGLAARAAGAQRLSAVVGMVRAVEDEVEPCAVLRELLRPAASYFPGQRSSGPSPAVRPR